VSLLPPIRELKLCYVTDRKALAATAEEQVHQLLEKIENAGKAGLEWVQIREKDLSARELANLVIEAKRRVPEACRILVNDRLDVARAAGASGVHLGEQSLSVHEAKRLVQERNSGSIFLVGASTHSLEAARAAEKAGADYLIFGPVFATPSKASFGQPQGIGRLAEVCRSVTIPVVAIGGITLENARECAQAGAGGIAAMRLFQEAADVATLVREMRQH
jgi:thiamine-phosphate pyrophosphorylase